MVWEAADRICGKRLKAALPHLVGSMERHGHLGSGPWGARASAGGQRRHPGPVAPAHQDTAAASSDAGGSSRRAAIFRCGPSQTGMRRHQDSWEIDLVVHHGGSLWGSMIHSLVATISAPAGPRPFHCWLGSSPWWWQDWRPSDGSCPSRQRHRLGQRQRIHQRHSHPSTAPSGASSSPVPGPYRKNDQAWIEQKNGAVVRHYVGHDRYSGLGGRTDHGPPVRGGATVRELLPAVVQVGGENSARLQGGEAVQPARHALRPADAARRGQRGDEGGAASVSGQLDPVALLHAIREAQSALAAVTFPEIRPTPSGESLEQFLASYPTCGSRMQRIPHGAAGANAPHLANSARPFRGECGATCWAGCRKTRMPVRWYCWADCKKLSQIVSAGLTCARCNAECSSGAAS